MKPSNRIARWTTGVLLAAFVMAAVAPAADASHRVRRYKGWDPACNTLVITRYQSPGSVYIVRRSSAGPAIAGFLGGLFLGATLAHAAPDGFIYHDPYCDEDFVTLEIYRAHLHHYHHPRVVRVLERDGGACVHTWRYQDGGWSDYDDRDWDDD